MRRRRRPAAWLRQVEHPHRTHDLVALLLLLLLLLEQRVTLVGCELQVLLVRVLLVRVLLGVVAGELQLRVRVHRVSQELQIGR
jgi:hypothetical protein